MKHILLAAVAAAGLLAASRADAAIMIRAEVSTGGPFSTLGTIQDNGVGDLDPTLGSVVTTFVGSGIGATLNTALGDPLLPQPAFSVTANAGTTAASGPLTLRLSFTQTDVSVTSGVLQSAFALTSLLLGGSGVQISSYVDDTNTPFGLTTPVFSQAFAATGGVTSNTEVTVADPYSETIVMVMSFNGGIGSANAGAQLFAVVPEPATLALFGAGLLGLGLAYRRRKPAAA